MLRSFTAKSVMVIFILGTLCVTLSAPSASLSIHRFANASLPGGCAEKILPGTRSKHSGVLCTSDQLFKVLSGGLAPGQTHDFSKVAQLGLGMVPADGSADIASFHIGSLKHPVQKVPIYLIDSVLTL